MFIKELHHRMRNKKLYNNIIIKQKNDNFKIFIKIHLFALYGIIICMKVYTLQNKHSSRNVCNTKLTYIDVCAKCCSINVYTTVPLHFYLQYVFVFPLS